MTEYLIREPDTLSQCPAHVHSQWNDISNSSLSQNNDEQAEYPTKMDEHKMFDEIPYTTVSSEIKDIHTIIHEEEKFATTVAKLGDNSFSEDVPAAVSVDTRESNIELRKKTIHKTMSFCLTNALNRIHQILCFLFLAKVS